MSAELQLRRSSRVADLAWPYQIVLDDENAGAFRNGAAKRLSTSVGKHTLQIRPLHIINRQIGLASPTETFEINDGETAAFVCHPHVCHPQSFARALRQWTTCLRGDRSEWIVLEPVASVD